MAKTKAVNQPKKQLPKEMKQHCFKPGQTGNPNGRPPISPIQRALKNLTIDTYREVIELVLTGNVAQLRAYARDPETSAIQVGIARAFMRAIKAGDYGVIERIAERIVGKIPDVVHVKSNNVTHLGAIDKAKLSAALDELEDEF